MNFIYHELKKKWKTRIAMAANVPYPSFNQRKHMVHDCCGTMHGFMNLMMKLHEYI